MQTGFQQNNAPCYVSKKSLDYFKQEDLMLLPWPAQSPDINIIENFWEYMENFLRRDVLRTKERFTERLFEIWCAIQQQFISNFNASLPRWMSATVDQARKEGIVTWRGNLWDQLDLVNFNTLIPKINVIRAKSVPLSLHFMFKPHFRWKINR